MTVSMRKGKISVRRKRQSTVTQLVKSRTGPVQITKTGKIREREDKAQGRRG